MEAGFVSPVMVGRGAEIAALRRVFGQTCDGSPGVVLLGGEVGAGKTRLITEFIGGTAGQAVVLSGGCVDLGGAGLAFAPYTAALRGLVRALGAEKMAALVPGGAPAELGRLVPALGAPRLPEPGPGGDADVARARLFEELLGLLENLADQQPVVLIIEDAHWADQSSRELLAFLARNLQPGTAVLILVSYRTDDLQAGHPLRLLLAELDRLPLVVRMELPRLSRGEMIAQIRAILGGPGSGGLASEVASRAEGNPLFVEVLLSSGGRLPESHRDLLLAGVQRLPEGTQGLLGAAAVAGAEFGQGLLEAATGVGEEALSEGLRPAVAAGVLVSRDGGFAFRHALIREAVQAGLLAGERGRWHARIARVFEADPGLAPGGRAAAQVAYHWHAAGEPTRALPAAWRAAAEATAALAYAEQLAMLDRVLELWDAVPDATRLAGAGRLEVLEQATAAAHLAGEPEHGVRLADAALAEQLMNAQLPEEAYECGEQALAAARRARDLTSEASALVTATALAARRGELATQLPKLAEARSIAEQAGMQPLLLRALQWEASLLEAYGEHERSAETAARGIATATSAGLARTFGAMHAVILAQALTSLGRWDEALEVTEHALGLLPPAGPRLLLLYLSGSIALARGEFGTAAAALGEARAQTSANGESFGTFEALMLGELEVTLLAAQGDTAAALAAAQHTLIAEGGRTARVKRFLWPLLAAAAEVACTAMAPSSPQDLAAASRTVLQLAASHAAAVPPVSPAGRAYRSVYQAVLSQAAGQPASHAWDDAASAWEQLGEPYRQARALLHAAETALAGDGDRDAAVGRLRQAADLADALGARPLGEQISLLAGRAHIGIAASSMHSKASDEPPVLPGLTGRELEVLRLVAAGCNNRDIAAELFISPKTASVHVSNILAKLGVHTRVEAAAVAHRADLTSTGVRPGGRRLGKVLARVGCRPGK